MLRTNHPYDKLGEVTHTVAVIVKAARVQTRPI